METPKPISFQKIIKRLILLIGVGILFHLAYILYSSDRAALSQLSKIHGGYLVAICVLALMPWTLHAIRLIIWSQFLGQRLSFRDALTVIIGNDLGSALTPTVVGGGPIKLAMLIQKGLPSVQATFLVLLSATEDLVFYGMGFLLASYYLQSHIIGIVHAFLENWSIFGGILVVIILFFMIRKLAPKSKKMLPDLISEIWKERINMWRAKFKSSLKEIGQTYQRVWREGKFRFLISLTLLFLQWISKFSILALILIALQVNVPYVDVIIKQWLIWISMLFIPTPGATGGAEAAFFLMFEDSIDAKIIPISTSVWRFFTYYYFMFVSILLFQILNGKTKSPSSNPLELNDESKGVSSIGSGSQTSLK